MTATHWPQVSTCRPVPRPAGRARRLMLAALAGMALAAPLAMHAQGLPTARPDEVGLSPQRLARIGDWLRAEVAQQKIPGAVIMVVRGGKVAYLDVMGQRGPDNPAPMKADDIFRIYSMTKPIVSVAALMLVEEGRLVLDAPVARYIPAFASVKVGIEKTDANGQKTLELVAPRRPMTVQDLMRHTSGLTYGFFGDGPGQEALRGQQHHHRAASSRAPSSPSASRRCRWPISPAVPGTTATRPTSSAASSRSSRARRCTRT